VVRQRCTSLLGRHGITRRLTTVCCSASTVHPTKARDLNPIAMHADAKAEPSASVGDAVDEEADHPKGKLTFSFVCIDYARCVDAFQVGLPRGICRLLCRPATAAYTSSCVCLTSDVLTRLQTLN